MGSGMFLALSGGISKVLPSTKEASAGLELGVGVTLYHLVSNIDEVRNISPAHSLSSLFASGKKCVDVVVFQIDEEANRSTRRNDREGEDEGGGKWMVFVCQGCGGESVWNL